MKHTQHIYGASDDLIELEGNINDELGGGEEPYYLLFNDGSLIEIVYDEDGLWAVNRVRAGTAEVERLIAPDREAQKGYLTHDKKTAPAYSDLLTLTWTKKLELVKHGSTKFGTPTPAQAKLEARANDVIACLSGFGGFDDWWHDIDNDDKNDIIAALAKVLDKS